TPRGIACQSKVRFRAPAAAAGRRRPDERSPGTKQQQYIVPADPGGRIGPCLEARQGPPGETVRKQSGSSPVLSRRRSREAVRMRLFDKTGVIHVHTRYSDGAGTVRRVAQAAVRAGLDFVIVTDHDTLAGLENGDDGWY